MNSPIQSAASDFNLLSAVELHRVYHGTGIAEVILLIHDSLVMEVRIDKVDEVRTKMHEVMVSIPSEYFPGIPFQAEVKVANQLGDLT